MLNRKTRAASTTRGHSSDKVFKCSGQRGVAWPHSPEGALIKDPLEHFSDKMHNRK